MEGLEFPKCTFSILSTHTLILVRKCSRLTGFAIMSVMPAFLHLISSSLDVAPVTPMMVSWDLAPRLTSAARISAVAWRVYTRIQTHVPNLSSYYKYADNVHTCCADCHTEDTQHHTHAPHTHTVPQPHTCVRTPTHPPIIHEYFLGIKPRNNSMRVAPTNNFFADSKIVQADITHQISVAREHNISQTTGSVKTASFAATHTQPRIYRRTSTHFSHQKHKF